MITLVIGLKSVVCVDSGTFILTVGVKEGPGHGAGVTSYGATARNDSPVNYDDISVFYRRVGKNTCAYQQVNCVVIIILIIPNLLQSVSLCPFLWLDGFFQDNLLVFSSLVSSSFFTSSSRLWTSSIPTLQSWSSSTSCNSVFRSSFHSSLQQMLVFVSLVWLIHVGSYIRTSTQK